MKTEYVSQEAHALSEGLEAIALSLRNLGTANAATPMGAVELVAMEIEKGTERIADALVEAAKLIADAVHVEE